MQFKTIIKYCYIPTRRAKLKKKEKKKKKILGASSKDMKQPELSFRAGRSVNWYSYFGNHFSISIILEANTRTVYDLVFPLFYIYPTEMHK